MLFKQLYEHLVSRILVLCQVFKDGYDVLDELLNRDLNVTRALFVESCDAAGDVGAGTNGQFCDFRKNLHNSCILDNLAGEVLCPE